ncbi:MAG: ExbD/TolR family protein [Burkholderiales bacterium]|jgi:biopolymer transport protein TolR
MPTVAHRGSASRRRTINEINMVPFIDVMLVLLIILMVSAPLISTGVVDLPSVGKARQRPDHVIEIVITIEESLKMRFDGKEAQPITLKNLVAKVSEFQAQHPDTPVIISADKDVKYEVVVKAMDTLQRGGIQRVGLAMKTGG